MDWLIQHWFGFLLLFIYSILLFTNAHIGMRRSRGGVNHFFVGGRSMGGVVIGISFFATFASTNSYLGHAGKGYDYGAPWLIFAIAIVFFTALSWKFVAPKLRHFTNHFGCITVPDFLALRFQSDLLRLVSGLVILLSSLLYLVAIFKGAGNLFQVFFGISYETALAITLVVVVLYTSIGGFVSVVRTDVIQGVLMLVGSLLIFGFVSNAAGGVQKIFSLSSEVGKEHLFTLDAGIPFGVMLGLALAGSLKLLIDPRQLTRFYGLRADANLRAGIWVAVGGILIIQFCLFPVGLYAHFLLDSVADTELIVTMLINDQSIFPTLFSDFLVVAILAAAMSSMDSVLLVAASTMSNDVLGYFRPIVKKDTRNTLVMTRLFVIGFATLSALIAINPPGGIVDITIFSGSLYAVCFVPTILLGLHWKRGDGMAALASIFSGVFVLISWLAFGLKEWVHELFPALAVSMITFVALSFRRAQVPNKKILEQI